MRFDAGVGVASAIGNTPLVELTRVLPGISFRLFAKLEALNVGGSMKDRAAFNMILRAIDAGTVGPGTIVIESSSGNMGIGLAQACRCYGLELICVVDPKITPQNRRLLESYGATIDMVPEPDRISGEFLVARLKRVQELLRQHAGAFWPNQYGNLANAEAHYQTIDEIVRVLDRFPDYLFCAVSTCGTLRGCATFLRDRGAPTRLIAVDAPGSCIFGRSEGQRLIPGHGAALRPELYDDWIADAHMLVSDLECVIGCRRLARTEALLMGGSSGAVLMAIARLKRDIPSGATCVAMLADRGERYLDTIYSDAWVQRQFGHVPDITATTVEESVC